MRRDLGGTLSRAQESLLEAAAQSWLILSSLDDWISRQPTLVTGRGGKRVVLPVILQRQTILDGLARTLDRLGLHRRGDDARDVASILASMHGTQSPTEAEP